MRDSHRIRDLPSNHIYSKISGPLRPHRHAGSTILISLSSSALSGPSLRILPSTNRSWRGTCRVPIGLQVPLWLVVSYRDSSARLIFRSDLKPWSDFLTSIKLTARFFFFPRLVCRHAGLPRRALRGCAPRFRFTRLRRCLFACRCQGWRKGYIGVPVRVPFVEWRQTFGMLKTAFFSFCYNVAQKLDMQVVCRKNIGRRS